MERIGDESERVDRITDEEFQEEEDAVNGQQDLDPATLGESHRKFGRCHWCIA
jgi:hypothetical protein